MHERDIAFLENIRQGLHVGNRFRTEVVLRPLDSLLGIRVETDARFVLDAHAVVVTDNANIHVVAGKADALIGIRSISH